VHSLIYLLSQFDIEHLYLVSPEHNNAALVPAIPQGLHEHLVESGTSFTTHNTLEIASLADVIYMTRSQTERRDSLDKLPAVLTLTKRVADLMPDSCIVLHPLPRLTEIPTWFDSDPRAKYFEQAAAGVAVRAVLMQCALEVYSYIPSGGTVSEALITDTMVNSI
jgi:aspartate carbamoyltransferase catalytic subunit